MNRRTKRIERLIRNAIGQVILSKLSDPRIDPARTSITHVEMPEDLLTAKVYASIIGTEAQQRRTMRALQHASGRIQELMMRGISLRHTPILDFRFDEEFKKTLKTLQIIDQAMKQITDREQSAGRADEGAHEPSAPAETR